MVCRLPYRWPASYKDPDTAIEAQAFSVQEPSFFFSMYSPPRTEAAYKLARVRLEEDLRFTSRMVRNFLFTVARQVMTMSEDNQCVRVPKRVPIHPLLHAIYTSPSRTIETRCAESPTAAPRGVKSLANQPSKRLRSARLRVCRD